MTERRGERSHGPPYGQPYSGRHRTLNRSFPGHSRDAKGKSDPGDESGVLGEGDNGRRDCLGDPWG